MLESIKLDIAANLTCKFSGLDSYEFCRNKNHFLQYPHTVNYKFNSRGFRDEEWPIENLENAIWCFGDSFTTGLGSPYEHIWTQVLQKKTNRRTINVSMDGASNSWITRKVLSVFREIKPKDVVIMWSYFHRREIDSKTLSDVQRRLKVRGLETIEDDLLNFEWCFNAVENNKGKTNVIYLTVPKPLQRNKTLYTRDAKNFLGEVTLLDYARDYHHFDINTSTVVVDSIIPLLSN